MTASTLGQRMPDEPRCNDESPTYLDFPPGRCTRPVGHPGWHYEGETYCWGDPGEAYGQRDPWTGVTTRDTPPICPGCDMPETNCAGG